MSATQVFLPAYTLWLRGLQRFTRQWSRMVGVIASPLLFWFLMGAGFKGSFQSSGQGGENYSLYFFPGTIVLVVLFTAIFSTISIIEDRREGFLQAVLVAPIARSGLVLGKIMGGTTVALVQGFILLALAPLIGIQLTVATIAAVAGVLFLIAFGLTGLGFLIAWRMDSSQGFHAIMNLFLVPMWLLSGAVFPVDNAPTWLKFLVQINPLTYGVEALRLALNGSSQPTAGLGIDALIVAGFGVVIFIGAAILVRQRKRN
jgi:ABC-2 type transport system permease protein